MMRLRLWTLSLTFLITASCSSTPKALVLERSDDRDEKPRWANLDTSSYVENGQHYFVGYVALSESASKSAALNMADEKAMSEPMRAIVKEFLDQNQVGETLTASDATGQRIISATRGYRPPMPGLRVVRRYWETVSVPTSLDGRRNELRAFSLAEIPEAEFASAKEAALRNLAGKPAVQKILDEVGESQRRTVLESKGK